MAEIGGGAAEVAGGLDLDVAGGGELMEGSVEILGQQFADAVELQADGLGERSGGEAAGGDGGCCRSG